jgi:hypothetical protein
VPQKHQNLAKRPFDQIISMILTQIHNLLQLMHRKRR